MAIDNFIPAVWSAAVTQAFQASNVIAGTLNNAFVGTVTSGNTVKITNAVTPTISNYTGSIAAESLADTGVEIAISNKKAFSFLVDDVDAAQAAGAFDAWTSAAGQALANTADKTIIVAALADAASNTTTAITTGAQAKAAVLGLRSVLSAANVPSTGRYLAVNSAFAALLLEGLSDAAQAGSSAELRNGLVGRLYGFDIVESGNFVEVLPQAVAYHEAAIAYIPQVEKVETLRSTTAFADIVRGLHVSGSGVVLPAGVAVVTATA